MNQPMRWDSEPDEDTWHKSTPHRILLRIKMSCTTDSVTRVSYKTNESTSIRYHEQGVQLRNLAYTASGPHKAYSLSFVMKRRQRARIKARSPSGNLGTLLLQPSQMRSSALCFSSKQLSSSGSNACVVCKFGKDTAHAWIRSLPPYTCTTLAHAGKDSICTWECRRSFEVNKKQFRNVQTDLHLRQEASTDYGS